MLETIEAIRTIKEIIGIFSVEQERLDYPNGYSRRLGEGLEFIYFSPSGVLGVLRKLSEREPITDADREAVASFNDYEWHVQQVFESFEFSGLSNRHLSIEQRGVLDKLRWRKLSVRRDVQSLLNRPYPLRRRSIEDVSLMIEAIENLNAEIEKCEVQLRRWRTV